MSRPDANSPTNSPTQSESSVTQSQATATKILTTLKAGTIRTLRSTSRVLEGTADRLEAADRPNPILLKIVNGLTIAGERSLAIWNRLLNVIRDRLPADLNGKLGDRTLSGILASAIVVLFWFTSSLFSSKPSQPVQVAARPPVTIPVQPTQFPSDLSAPEIVSTPIAEVQPEPNAKRGTSIAEVEPIAEVPVEAPAPEPPPIEPVEAPIAAEPSPQPESNVDLGANIAEPLPESITTVEKVEAPPPEPELTPEQKQIAAIQSQVMEISDRFIGGLVMSVEPQIDRARIKVRVSEDWYRFSAEQQDRFANELWARSQTLDLPKLEITDAQGSLLARTPIVGESMVILRRKSTIA